MASDYFRITITRECSKIKCDIYWVQPGNPSPIKLIDIKNVLSMVKIYKVLCLWLKYKKCYVCD